jgi:hypothetical protein
VIPIGLRSTVDATAAPLGMRAALLQRRRWHMRVQLTPQEAKTLKAALDRTLLALEFELAHTEAPSLQHALNRDYQDLRALRARFGFDQEMIDRHTPAP